MRFERVGVRAYGGRCEGPEYRVIVTGDEFASAFGEACEPLPVDFGRYVLVTASRGLCRSGGYRIRITSVEQCGGQVRVTLEFRDPAPGEIVTLALTYPQDAVVIAREAFWPGGQLEFVFADTTGRELGRFQADIDSH